MIAKGAIKVGGDMESEDENPEDETEEKKEEKEEGKKKRKGKEKESEDEEDDEEMQKEMMNKKVEEKVEKKVEKSLVAFGKIVKSVVDDLSDQLAETKEIVKSLSNQTPTFKSQGFEQHAVIEKSIKPQVDENGKMALNVHTQRAAVRETIANILEKEPNSEIKKSLTSSAFGYLCTDQASLPEDVCQYLYEKNIRLVK